MKYFKIVPVSLIAFLAACDSGTSPDNSFSNKSPNNGSNGGSNISSSLTQGELQYERHFDRNVPASMKCNVYSTNNSVSLDLKYSILDEANVVTEIINVKYGSPTTYDAKMEVSGLMQMAASSACARIKDDASGMDNAIASCTENGAVLTASLPNLSDADVARVISPTVEKFKLICDESYDKFYSLTDELIADLNITEQPKEGAEKALSCNVQTNGNTIQMNVAFPGKNVVFTMLRNNDTYYLTEEYTGIDEATLSNVCAAYKTESGIENVNCAGPVISYTSSAFTSEGVSLDVGSVAAAVENVQCPALLNGTMTLEDLWYNK